MELRSKRWKTCVAWILAVLLCLGGVVPQGAMEVQAEEEEAIVFHAEQVVIADGVPETQVDYQGALNQLKDLSQGTVTVRYRAAKSGLMSLFSVADATSANCHTHIYVNGSTIGYEVRNGSSNVNTGSAAASGACDGQWHTLTYVFASSGTRAYYDGEKVLENQSSGFISSSPNPDTVSLGKTARPSGSNQYLFSGTIHEIQVRSDVLTEEEILASHAPTVREEKEAELPDSAYRTEDQALFYQGYQGSVSYRIPSLLTTHNGTVLAAIDKRQSGSGDQGNIDTSLRRSFDNGKTWTDGQIVYNMPAGASQHALTIDPVMVEDKEIGRIFMLVDMFPESQAAMNTGLLEQGSGYKEVNGKNYCILRDYESKLDSTHNYTKTYTIREHGEVWLEGSSEADAIPTEYTVPNFHTGELFKNDEPAGNIFIYTGANAGELKVVRNMRIWSSYSDDDGETWSDPVDLTYFYKKDWMLFAGVGPGVGIQLEHGEHRGRLVVPIYVTNSSWTASQASAVIFSDDHGETWQMCETSPLEAAGLDIETGTFNGSIITESQVVEMNDGTLVQFFRNSSGAVKYSTSMDGGNTWTAPVRDSAVNDVYCQLTAVHYPDQVDGQEAVILANPNGPSGRQNGHIRIGLYNQDEKTFEWKYSQQINQGSYAYSCLSILPNGDIGLLYEENIPDILFTSLSLDWITSPRMELTTKPVIQNIRMEKGEGELIFIVGFDSYMLTMGTPVLNFTMDGEAKEAAYVSGNAARELTFRYTGDVEYERITVRNVSASEGNDIGSASGEQPDDSEFTFLGDGQAVCTCKIEDLRLEPEKIFIPEKADGVTRNLEGRMKESGCAREDHQFQPVYSFTLEDAGETQAQLSDGKLTVSQAGTVIVKVHAQLNGVTNEAVCEIPVEKAQAGEDVNQPPTAKSPVPVQTVDSLEGGSFTAEDIAEDPENMPLTITRVMTDPGSNYIVDLKDGVVTIFGAAEGSTVIMVSVSDGEKSTIVSVPVEIAAGGAYEKKDSTYLSDLDCLTSQEVGYGSLQVDHNIDGGTITLKDEAGNRVAFEKGYGAHCNSDLLFTLPQDHHYRIFKTSYGVDASKPAVATITFRIYVDEELVHTSSPLQSTSTMGKASVDITGARTLRLTATHGGTDGSGHSVWAGSRLVGGRSPEIYTEALDRKIQEGKSYSAEGYTQESYQALQRTVSEAEEILGRDYGEQLDIYEQMQAISRAVKNLRASVEATGITLNHGELAIEQGKTRMIYATLETADGSVSTDRVAWSSDHPEIAAVSETGRVSAVSLGTATVTATTDSGMRASCQVTVTPAVMVEVSFSGGEGAVGEEPEAITARPGTDITLPENTFEREGYDFTGWSDGSGVYASGSSYQVPAGDITLTAAWEKKELPSVRIENITGSADSQQASQPGSYAVDGNEQTHWHSNWSSVDVVIDPDNPDSCENNGYTIDLGQEYDVTKLEYLPRQGSSSGNANGRITKYRVRYSLNGEDYQDVILTGSNTWENNEQLKAARFEPVKARYIRIEALGSVGDSGNNKFINAAEFYVYRVDNGTKECTCVLGDVQFQGENIQIPAREENVRVELNGEAVLGGDCQAEGHAGAKVQIAYEIEEGQGIASIQGNVLVLEKEGTVKVKATAAANGKEASKTAVFTVTREKNETYKLSFTGGEGATGTAPDVIIGEAGTRVTLPENTFTKPGYEFVAWSDGTDAYAERSDFDMRAQNLTFVALWQKKEQKPGDQTPSLQAPKAPENLRASSNKTNKVKLSWEKAEGATGYLVYRYDSANKTWKPIKRTAGTSYTDKKLKKATVYQYKVRAYRQSGNQIRESSFSSVYKTATAPAKPAIKLKKVNGSKLKITWKKCKGSTGYEIYRRTGKGKYKNVSDKKAKSRSYVNSKLKKGKTYTFRMRAYKKVGGKRIYSAYSKAVKKRM